MSADTHDTLEKMPTAVVTGGSRGIGRAIAETLSNNGYQVYFTYVSRQAEADSLVELIHSRGGKARAFRVDGTDPAAIVEFFKNEIKDKIALAVLVNNAGISRDGLILRMKDEDFDLTVNANMRSAVIFLREAAKIMTRQRYGKIVNLSSVVGQSGNAGQISYSASKAGLIGVTKSAAKELGSRNITVNAIAPGFIDTDMTSELSEDVKAAYSASIPLGRMGVAQDVADAVSFLVSDRAAYITGQVLAVNGGLYM